MYTLKYQKTLLHALLLLAFKILENLHCILKRWYKVNTSYKSSMNIQMIS